MERKQIRSITAIQTTTTKKESSGKLDPKGLQKDRQERDQRRLHREQIRRAFVSGWIKAVQYGKNLEKNQQKEIGVVDGKRREMQ